MTLQRNSAYPVHAVSAISDGVDGVRETLATMRELVRIFRANPQIREIAENIIRHIPAKDFFAEVEAIFDFVRNNVRYTFDILEVETIKDPLTLLSSGMGDCDDMAVLLASLLNAVGHPARFKVVGRERGQFEHVFVQTRVGPSWYSLDPTESHPPGWEPPQMRQEMVWRI